MPQDLRANVVEVLKTIYDPEIPVNIYEMGLVYDLLISNDGSVVVTMTLTAPNCPVAGSLPKQVEQRVSRVEGVTSAKVDLVFDPPWDMSKMSDVAKLTLGFDLGPTDTVPLSKIR
jgi:FeS assembly SUF system protein